MTKSRIDLKEDKAKLNADIIKRLWSEGEILPRLTPYEKALYFLTQSIKNLLYTPVNNLISALMIFLSLYVFGSFLVIFINIDNLLVGITSSNSIVAYFTTDTSRLEINEALSSLDSSKVLNSKITTQEDAYIQLKKDFESNPSLVDGVESSMLPPSLDISVANEETIPQFIEVLKKNSKISEIQLGSKWGNLLANAIYSLRIWFFVFIFISFILISFVVGSTMRLLIYSRRQEIMVMRLVGAREGFVRIPFIVGGMFQGLFGALVALSVLKVSSDVFFRIILNSKLEIFQLSDLSFLPGSLVFLILLIGVIVGGVGSFFAINKFIDV